MDEKDLLEAIGRAVLEGEDRIAVDLARRSLDLGLPPLGTVEKGLVPGIREAGRLWDEGEYFLPELVGSAQAMKAAMAVLRPAMADSAAGRSRGRVVIGTVEGDIHDIGKTLVATLLAADGFEVYDEGAEVPVDRFLARAREIGADLVCASALLTTTMLRQRELVAAVRAAGLPARVMVGGAPVTADWARTIGADGFAENAVAAVQIARGLVGRHDA